MQKNRQLIKEDKVGKEMILKSTMYQKQNIDLSSAPGRCMSFCWQWSCCVWSKRMFSPVWANDISEQKAAVYEANFGRERFVLDDIKNIRGATYLSLTSPGPVFLVRICLWLVLLAESMRPAVVWFGNGYGYWTRWTKNLRFYCWRMWRDCCLQTVATITVFFIWRS